jgi:hypothetical protein
MPNDGDAPLPWSFWAENGNGIVDAEERKPAEISKLTGKPMRRVPIRLDCSSSTRRRRTTEAKALIETALLSPDATRDRLEQITDHEFSCAAKTFNSADTLQTSFSRAEALDIFRMGQYLALTDIPLIQSRVKKDRSSIVPLSR